MRTFMVAAGAGAMIVGMLLVPAGTATAADAGGITCHGGSGKFQFSPGVTVKRQTVQFQGNGDLGRCASPSKPKITGGLVRFVGTGSGVCPGPFAIGYGKMMISWNDGSSSAVSQLSFRAGSVTWSADGGSVTAGSFQGQAIRITGRSTTPATEMGAQCVTSGLTTYDGTIDSTAIGSSS